jgi:hypothetical protein
VDPDEADVRAHVPPADPARIAVTTRGQRPDRDALAGTQVGGSVRPHGFDDARELVALDARIQVRSDRVSEVSEEVVEVGSAETDRLRPHQHLAGPGLTRFREVDDLHYAAGARDRGSHSAASSPSVSWPRMR